MTAADIARLAETLNELLPARILSIHALADHGWSLGFRGQDSASLVFFRGMGLVESVPRRLRQPLPSDGNAQWLRAHLEGALLDSVAQPKGDRILRLRVLRAENPLTLVVSLFRAMHWYAIDDHDAVVFHDRHPKPAELPVAAAAATPPQASDGADPWDLGATTLQTLSDAAWKVWAQQLKQERKRHQRTLTKLEADLNAASEADALQADAELLQAKFHEIPGGAQHVELAPYDEPEATRRITLDASRTASENVALLFKKARRRRMAAEEARSRAAVIQSKLQDVDVLLQRIEIRDKPDQLIEELAARYPAIAKTAAPTKQKAATSQAPKGISEYRTPHQAIIWVGKGARENDTLTMKMARGSDTWMHVRDYPGAHVVIRTPGRQDPHPQDVDAALQLALASSKVPEGVAAEVLVGLKKHISKAKGAKPGQVLVAKAKSRRVMPDADALKSIQGWRIAKA